jgi:hypothetical protein
MLKYNTLRGCTRVPRQNLKFQVKIIDSNHSIYSPYPTLIENQNLYLKKNSIFLGRKKIITIGRSKILKSTNFLLTQKDSKKKLKNIKLYFLQEFDMKNKLNDLDQSFLT